MSTCFFFFTWAWTEEWPRCSVLGQFLTGFVLKKKKKKKLYLGLNAPFCLCLYVCRGRFTTELQVG